MEGAERPTDRRQRNRWLRNGFANCGLFRRNTNRSWCSRIRYFRWVCRTATKPCEAGSAIVAYARHSDCGDDRCGETAGGALETDDLGTNGLRCQAVITNKEKFAAAA